MTHFYSGLLRGLDTKPNPYLSFGGRGFFFFFFLISKSKCINRKSLKLQQRHYKKKAYKPTAAQKAVGSFGGRVSLMQSMFCLRFQIIF